MDVADSPTSTSEPHPDFELDTELFTSSFRDALVGIALLWLSLLAFVTTIGLIGGLFAGSALLYRQLSPYLPSASWVLIPLGIVVGVVVLYTLWTAAFCIAMSALRELGLGFHGKAVYWVLPFSPAIALICGPLAFLARVGRGTKGPYLVIGLAVVLSMVVAFGLRLSGLVR